MDQIDRRILNALQADSNRSQRELAEAVGLSQNALWRRIKALEANKIITGYGARVDATRLGAKLRVFVLLRTRHHSAEWLKAFRKQIELIPNVIGFYRISGEYDYLLKVAIADMSEYDSVYQRIIEKTELDTVTSYFCMEAILDERPVTI